MSRHFAMRVPFPQASPALEADAGTGEEGDRLREGLAARMASGPGLWLEELEGLDRRGLVEQLLAGDVTGEAVAAAPHGHRLDRVLTQLDRIDLLICDELGFVRLDPDQAQLLFILLAHRYTRGALAVSSNLEFSDWTSVFNDDARMVAALLDRLTHRCHLLEFQGESYRFRQSLAARARDKHSTNLKGRSQSSAGASHP